MPTTVNTRAAAARGFVRSLNILLKFARMYDFGHPRTAKQYETAWNELRTALGSEEQSGVLLAVSGDQLLLDGTPLESSAAEKSFAHMLSSAGIASIHFAANIPQSSLAKFVRAFPSGNNTKPAQVAEQLKLALAGDTFIHINEVCFVPADSAVAKSTVAAQLAARTLGMSSAQTDELFKDPEKLLQLIVAAEGTKGGPGGPGRGSGDGSGGSGNGGPGGFGFAGGGGGQGSGGSGYGTGGSGGSGGGGGFGSGGEGAPGGGSAYSGGGSALEGPASFQGTGAAGPAGTVGGNAGWNIVGGSGNGTSGTPVDPNVGGFWLNRDAFSSEPSSAAGSGAPSGAGLSGPVAGVGGSGGASGWNIVGGNSGGVPVDPNAGGFWLNKNNAPGPNSGASGLTGPASGVGESSGSGNGGYRAGGADGGNGPGGYGSYNGSGGYGPGNEGASRWGSASSGIRSSRSARGGPGSMAVDTGLMTLQEQELQGILQVLAQIARTSDNPKEKFDANSFQSRLSTLPRRARFTVSQALSALAAQAPTESQDKPTLLKLAEHVAVRFALESYERGDVKVNAVREMLGDMSAELDGLRKILGVYEEKMARAGIEVQSHIETLAQEFWTQVPEDKRRKVLEGVDAWCVPGSKVREHVDLLRSRGETEQAEKVLIHYASFISDKVADHRRQVAMGLAELASLYANSGERLLVETIRQVGLQLAEEKDGELQSQMSAAFVRLSQEAGASRSFLAMQRSVEMADYLEGERAGTGKGLQPRIGVSNKLPEFIDEALKAGETPKGLADLLRRMPEAASENIAARFSRSGFREDCEQLIAMFEALGPEALEHLRHQLRDGSPHQAVDAVGILARLDIDALQEVLPKRLSEWKRTAHDRLVRQIASSGAGERGRLLADIFDHLDPMIRPLAIDEIGMSGERSAETRLLRIAEGNLPRDSTNYLQLKAVEALGRLRTPSAGTILRRIVEARKTWRWASPAELRIVAAQALEKLDPDWARNFMPQSGLSAAELSIEPLEADPSSSATRQRRYPRLRLERPVFGATLNLKENCRIEVPEMALGGGVALSEQNLHPGSVVELKLNAGQKQVRAQTIIRDANTQARAFEVIEMDLEERAKLRKMLVQLGNAPKEAKPQSRNKRGQRTIYNTQS